MKNNQQNTKNTSYEKLRFQIIKKRFSSISDKKAQYLAENTSGLVESQHTMRLKNFCKRIYRKKI